MVWRRDARLSERVQEKVNERRRGQYQLQPAGGSLPPAPLLHPLCAVFSLCGFHSHFFSWLTSYLCLRDSLHSPCKLCLNLMPFNNSHLLLVAFVFLLFSPIAFKSFSLRWPLFVNTVILLSYWDITAETYRKQEQQTELHSQKEEGEATIGVWINGCE